MSTSFLDLPRELRDRVYELSLVRQKAWITPANHNWTHLEYTDYTKPQTHTPGLLRTNKIIYREANFLLYSKNRFNFIMDTPGEVASFLRKIGHNNAQCIRHVCIDFTNLCSLKPGSVTLEEDSNSVLTSIQSRCTSLTTVSLYNAEYAFLHLDAIDYPNNVTEAVTLVNTRLRAILSPQAIFAQLFEDDQSEYIKTEMQRHGWTVENGANWGPDGSFRDVD